jgi:hypothetical protein
MPALAQDSVSKNLGGLPGDALSPWDTGLQCASYVVDLAPFTGSWGTEFAIAPLVKAGKGSFFQYPSTPKEYFTCQLFSQGISRMQALDVAYPVPTYKVWSGTPGQGVHPVQNNPPGTTSPAGTSNQFAVAFVENGTSAANTSYNGLVSAVVNYAPADPTRLYVKRVMAATNGVSTTENRSQFGFGAVDEWGDMILRADGYGSTGPNTLVNKNIFYVGALARNCSALNFVDNAGLSDVGAGSWIVVQSATEYNTANIGPKSIFGVPYFLGSNFDKQYAYGPVTPPSYSTTIAHRPGTADHRGGVAYMTKNVPCVAGTHGTAAMLSYVALSGPSTSISVWGLDAAGGVSGTLLLTKPSTQIVDPVTGMHTYTATAFDHYHSQVAQRGGNSPVAINVDQQGRLLVAGVLYDTALGTVVANQFNNLVAARVTCGSPNTIEWSLVAYSTDDLYNLKSGKPILNGHGGAAIGRLVGLDEVTGGVPQGPSMSAPMIDSAGNIWFISAMLWFGADGIEGTQDDDYDSALIRAVYNSAVCGWELEEIAEVGMVFSGQNSGLPWRINFLEIADSNSVSSGTAWSGNISETGHLGVNPGPDVPTWAPTTLGGVVIYASILYDVNGDGTYNDPTSSNYNPNAPSDEAYNALLYIGARVPGAPPACIGDLNCDGQINFGDINPFVLYLSNFATWQAAYAGCNPANGDINCDGTYGQGSFGDINPFVSVMTQCGTGCTCPGPVSCP